MRVFPLLLAALLLVPLSAGEFGIEDEDGYPVSPDGYRHNPALRMSPEALAAVQELAMQDARSRGLLVDGAVGTADHGTAGAAGDGVMGNDYPPLNQAGPATLYPYYPILTAEIQRLALDHPDKVRLHTAGKSEAGLDLTFLEIADFANADMKPLEEREVLWIDGGTHSNEYSGVYFVLAMAQWLLDGSPEDEFAQWVLENRHTWIMPMVNPDGSHLMGRVNANLVNINRNYPVIWGGQGTDDLLNNPGPTPTSEVETQINIEWMKRLVPDYYASIHCCGNLWLYPYGEDGYDPADNQTLATICRVALPDVGDRCGPIWSTIYPASGSSVDTAYEFTGAAGWGFEMSGRSNLVGIWGEPVTFEEVAVQERESWGAIMHAFEHVHLYGGHPVIEAVRVGQDTIELTIRNTGYGPVTNASVTVRDDSRDTHVSTQTPLPDLDANETAVVVLDKPAGDAQAVRVDYSKRLMAAPPGTVSLAVKMLEDGTFDAPEGVVVEPLEALAAPDEDAPAIPAALFVVALVALALRRR